MNKKLQRKLKLTELLKTKERKEFEKEHTCFLGMLRAIIDFNTTEAKIVVDRWFKVDPSLITKENVNQISQAASAFKLTARFNTGSEAFGVWLPNEILSEHFDPNDHLELIKKYKFKI